MRFTEKQQEERQRSAYKLRESIQPGDCRTMICADADEEYCYFHMRSGNFLACDQPAVRIEKGEKIKIRCSEMCVAQNGYGKFVDYVFKSDRLINPIRINGYDAQSLNPAPEEKKK